MPKNDSLTLRDGTSADIQSIIDWLSTIKAATWSAIDFENALVNQHYHVRVIIESGQIAGFLCGYVCCR